MRTKVTPIEELQRLVAETLLQKTSKVNKISNNSVLGGITFGIAKVAQKATKDIALIETQLFPDFAEGDTLDIIAANYGIAPRFGASGSSTYVLLVGDPGTQYFPGVHRLNGSHGYSFDFEGVVTVGGEGYTYAKVRSADIGSKTNVDPLTISQINPVPTGHKYCINEYAAFGGRDFEQDDVFRQRIKEGPNILATRTLSQLEQVFIKINSNVLKVYHHGINQQGQVIIAIATQNGINLTESELDDILARGEEYFSLTEYKPFGSANYGILLRNIEWYPIDVSFRVEILPSFNPDAIRKAIQVKFSKYLDFRFFNPSEQKVEWDDLLQIVKSTRGVKYVPDQYFYPSADIKIPKEKLPRVRGFVMLDLNGNLYANSTNTLSPVFYPNKIDFSYRQTVLSTI